MADPPRRKPSRLAADDFSCRVCLTLPTRQVDAYCRHALKHGASVAAVIRQDLQRVLRRHLTPTPDDPSTR